MAMRSYKRSSRTSGWALHQGRGGAQRGAPVQRREGERRYRPASARRSRSLRLPPPPAPYRSSSVRPRELAPALALEERQVAGATQDVEVEFIHGDGIA